MRILVADDDRTWRDYLNVLLTRWGFEVVTVSNGYKAAGELSDDPPPIIILDWNMPGPDGFELARSIREDETTRDAYVLMITGSREKDEIMRVLVCGADDYLLKPFDAMDLKIHLRTARRVLQLQDEIRSLRASLDSEPGPRRTAEGLC
jgi:DNA-binding response OmpR family regulator